MVRFTLDVRWKKRAHTFRDTTPQPLVWCTSAERMRRGKAKDTMNAAQETAFVNLVKHLRDQYGPLTLHGHNEYAAKACPSFIVKDKFKWLVGY
jgi:hypothetical protein